MPPQRTGLLIVRAWLEPGSTAPLRARVHFADDIAAGFHTLVVAQPDEVERLVSAWLRDFLGPH